MNPADSAPELMRTLFNGWEPENSIARAVRVTQQHNVNWFTKIHDGKVVSSVTLYLVDLLSRRLAVIEEVVTLPEYRNRGYATELVREAIKYARESDADCVELCVRKDNVETIRFYQKLGFQDRQQTVMRLQCQDAR